MQKSCATCPRYQVKRPSRCPLYRGASNLCERSSECALVGSVACNLTLVNSFAGNRRITVTYKIPIAAFAMTGNLSPLIFLQVLNLAFESAVTAHEGG